MQVLTVRMRWELVVVLVLVWVSATVVSSMISEDDTRSLPQPILVTGAPEGMAIPNVDLNARFDVREFGAVGDGRTNCTGAFVAAIAAASQQARGGVVVVSSGQYLIGEIHLRSNVFLFVESDGVVLGSADVNDYMAYDWIASNPAVIRCINQSNTGIIGNGGTLDGQAVPRFISYYDRSDDRFQPIQWQGLGPSKNCQDECRPRLLQFTQCHNVLVRDVNLQNSADWTSHYLGCSNVFITNLTITGDHRFPNNDGIDIDSSINVTVRDVRISTGDDGVCPKSTRGYGKLDNVLIENVQVASRSGAFKIGSATDEDMSNLLVREFDILSPTNRGLGIQHRDSGSVAHIRFENVRMTTSFAPTRWWGTAEPISITTLPRDMDGSNVGPIFNISFVNITARSQMGAVFVSTRGAPAIDLLSFDSVSITLTRTSEPESGVAYAAPQLDFRPAASPEVVPLSFVNVMWFDGVKDVQMGKQVSGTFDNFAHDAYLSQGVCINGTDSALVKQIDQVFACFVPRIEYH